MVKMQIQRYLLPDTSEDINPIKFHWIDGERTKKTTLESKDAA